MFAAILIHCGPRAARIRLATDSHSCRDQWKTRGASARVLSQTIRGQGSGIHIPACTMTRGGTGAIPCQVSLGNTKWAQEILRPVSAMSQPETTTNKQHNTFIIPAPAPETELGSGDGTAAKNRDATTATTSSSPAGAPTPRHGSSKKDEERRREEQGADNRPEISPPKSPSLLSGTPSGGGGRGAGGPAAAPARTSAPGGGRRSDPPPPRQNPGGGPGYPLPPRDRSTLTCFDCRLWDGRSLQ